MPMKSRLRTITRDQNWRGPAIDPEMLLEEYLKPLGIGQVEAARELGVSLNRLNEIVRGKGGITADTALRLARFLKTSPQLWMRLQSDWNLHQAMRRGGAESLVNGPTRCTCFVPDTQVLSVSRGLSDRDRA
jgi:addiction module HigA family antidote